MAVPEVCGVIPHDPGAFTQGLEIHNGFLWESTGIYGESTFRRTSAETGEILDLMALPGNIFAEGFTFLNDTTVCLLTWRENRAFIISTESMEITGEHTFQGEGWGLCQMDDRLFQSNGTSVVTVRDPDTFEPIDSLCVTLNGVSQYYLNELEAVNGKILANQWRSSRILVINPSTGVVERVINLRNLVPAGGGAMNGLAVDHRGRLYCTGKNWPVTFILDNTGWD